MTTPQQKIAALGIVLPQVAAPAAAYVMTQRVGDMLFLSGHIAKKEGKVWAGQLGGELTTADGKAAARAVAIDMIATLSHAVDGKLEQLRIIKLMGLVNSTSQFIEQHLVINGASELFVEVFGERGRHARSAFGVAQIPLGACVEIELIAAIEDA